MENMLYLFITIAFKQNKLDTSFLKLDDALPETFITIPKKKDKFCLFNNWQSK